MIKKTSIFTLVLIAMLSVASLAMAGTAGNFPGVLGNAVVDVDDGNSVVKIMGNIHIPADRVVDGDVVAIMGNVDVEGQVNGEVVAVIGNISINNVVNGDVVSVLGNITKGPQAQINGELVEANRPGNFVAGRYVNMDIINLHDSWAVKAFNMVILLALASLVLALMPTHTKSMTVAVGDEPLRKILIGLLALVLTPVVVVITAISIIGLPLVPLLILLFMIAKFIGYVAVALYIGNRVKNASNMNINIFLELFIGVLLLWLLRLVPILGMLSALVVTLFALGVVFDTKFGTGRPWFKKREYAPIESPKHSDDENNHGRGEK